MVGEKRLWKLDQGLCVLLMLLIPLQLCLSIANLFYGIDKGYGHSFPLWSYVLSAAYLCVVLSADGFMICVGRLELSKFVGRYWLSACGALAAAALLRLVPEGGMLFIWQVRRSGGDQLAVSGGKITRARTPSVIFSISHRAPCRSRIIFTR